MFEVLKDSSERIRTGVILVAVVLFIGVIDSKIITWLFLGGIMMVGVSEAMKLFKSERNLIYLVSGFTWILAYFYPNPQDLVFLSILFFASILAYTKTFDKALFLPLLYPLVSYLFLFSLYLSFGMGSLLWLLVLVAGTDVGAYFVGRSIGKRQFCATSPKKTLEGVFGGVLIAMALGFVFAPSAYEIQTILFVSFVVSLGSVFGDLFESYLKREADVKDSGDILPGHGGILDRTDGYLFGGILMYILLKLLVI
ncbi:MAG: phosphatidate cytidylyltransferase [Arcobacteraceae bacterium]|jgi:phosphatidate cytidylyltransferase|nr:phosphatidate cytidylyltransferase [Arcobacteraceae bacterium]